MKVVAFARKELVDIVRQPRLLLTLILGPFLILALFAAGYQRSAGAMRAVLVVSEQDMKLLNELEDRLAELNRSIVVQETTESQEEALEILRRGNADAVVVVPPDPYGTVRGGDQALFVLLHDTQDPFEQATIRLTARAAIDEMNRELLAEAISTGQRETADFNPFLTASRESAVALRTALEAGDTAAAEAERSVLETHLASIDEQITPADSLVAALDGDRPESNRQVTALRQRIAALDLSTTDGTPTSAAQEVRTIEAEIEDLESTLSQFQTIAPDVLVSPLAVDTELISPVEVTLTDFYAPGVIALLLQHLAITFAAMSLVRERSLGATEVFGIAPVGPSHILIGKYLGYTIGAGVIALGLNTLLLTVFEVPLAGSMAAFVTIQLLLTLASLGVGFVISSIVSTDHQAVNAAMIVLLLSIFFSGFFLSLDRLLPEVRVVSWMLPITHALDSLRDVMFRGAPIDLRTWIALGGGSLVLYAVSWLLMRRRVGAA